MIFKILSLKNPILMVMKPIMYLITHGMLMNLLPQLMGKDLEAI